MQTGNGNLMCVMYRLSNIPKAIFILSSGSIIFIRRRHIEKVEMIFLICEFGNSDVFFLN